MLHTTVTTARNKKGQFLRGTSGETAPRWKGGISTGGFAGKYLFKFIPSHPRSSSKGYVGLHIIAAEAALGHYLPDKAQVHHVDGNPSNNRNDNLVVCQDDAYHKLLHLRARALKACGNAKARLCRYCKQWDDPSNLVFYADTQPHHVECRRKDRCRMRKEKRAAVEGK